LITVHQRVSYQLDNSTSTCFQSTW